jgi:hypothetical protein
MLALLMMNVMDVTFYGSYTKRKMAASRTPGRDDIIPKMAAMATTLRRPRNLFVGFQNPSSNELRIVPHTSKATAPWSGNVPHISTQPAVPTDGKPSGMNAAYVSQNSNGCGGGWLFCLSNSCRSVTKSSP